MRSKEAEDSNFNGGQGVREEAQLSVRGDISEDGCQYRRRIPPMREKCADCRQGEFRYSDLRLVTTVSGFSDFNRVTTENI